ncbi:MULTISPECIES: mechanosensitive ion channel family protein [unclassified Okeania]|uniref:mechanosensitive ion channel family protein n=1 Tax=unclassified Okeania TaxID=2634635 RepID=UPI0013BB4594|nr:MULTISPECIES: mechanosensitive ion channel family protein [unclassified Okeania]NES77806.1 mechanosensitive ion channel family protein [Okeania sp. SIO1H4]NET16564.1 mechanosensitive ion channel family protein [Okeania sp. SIO1H6]NET22806.1 mechanosensitive ion channel family protein [Okeania sp. SIO1H5]NET97017.1 mechanosensitive ion channel family protein [Okeania sp. SIO1H2]
MDLLEQIWNSLGEISIFGLSAYKLLFALGVLLLTLILQGFIAGVIIKSIEGLASNTKSDLDDQLIFIIKEPLSWLVLLAGFWAVHIILIEYISAELNKLITDIIGLAAIALVANVIYRSAPLLGQLLKYLTIQTETDLDDLLVPYFPRLFRIAAIVVVCIKGAEVFLGASAGALIGLLGGAGVALGLLFKDIIYDWCCAIIIYTDRLYRPGDWIAVTGLTGFFQVSEIGLRTTKLYAWEWGSIIKMPNSRMVGGIVDNWSQNRADVEEWGITGTLKIDGITADQAETIMAGLDEIFKSMEGILEHYIMFNGVEGNARIIKYVSYHPPAGYSRAAREFHLKVMRLMEKEGIAAQNVYIITDTETYAKNMKMASKN